MADTVKTCATCQDYSHRWQCCFCPLNAGTSGYYMPVKADSKACPLHKEGKNDYPQEEQKASHPS